MRKIMMKFCDERKKEFCMKTTIWKDGEQKKVSKEAIFPESLPVLKKMQESRPVLEEIYPEAELCKSSMEKDVLWFEFVEGLGMEEELLGYAADEDREGFLASLNRFVSVMESTPENHMEFQMTEEFWNVFGSGEPFRGMDALKRCDYDMIPGNIIVRDGKMVLIDFEWLMEFPVPVELLKYHAFRELYQHCGELEAFFPLDELLTCMGITMERDLLEDAYGNFLHYVSGDSMDQNFSAMKASCLKPFYDFRGYCQFGGGNHPTHYVVMEKAWYEVNEANRKLSQQVEDLRRQVELEQKNHMIHARQIEDAVQEQARQSEVWREAYETVVNSRTWQTAGKLKRLVGKKQVGK